MADSFNPFDPEQLTRFAVRRLAAFIPRREVTREVCLRTGWSWSQARAWVDRVWSEQGPEIARRRYPTLVSISLVTLFVGSVLVGAGVIAVAGPLLESLLEGTPVTLSMVLALVMGNMYTLQLSAGGLAMVAGAAIGLSRAQQSRWTEAPSDES